MGRSRRFHGFHGINPLGPHFLDPVDFSRHQLQSGIAVRRPAFVVQGDPARQIPCRIIFVEDHHIIGPPAYVPCQIGDLQLMGVVFAVFVQPGQCGLSDKVFRQFRQHFIPGVPQINLLTDPIRLPLMVAQQCRSNNLLSIFELVEIDDLDLLAHIFIKKLAGIHQVIFVILF